MVGGWEKYCPRCIENYGVEQDGTFHKRNGYLDEVVYKMEFEKDLARAKNTRKSIKSYKAMPVPRAVEIKPVYYANRSAGRNNDPAYRKRFGSRPSV